MIYSIHTQMLLHTPEVTFPLGLDTVLMHEIYDVADNDVRVALYRVSKVWRGVAEQYTRETFWSLDEAFAAGCDVAINVLMDGNWPRIKDVSESLEGCMSVSYLRRFCSRKIFQPNVIHPLCYLRSRGADFVEKIHASGTVVWSQRKVMIAHSTLDITSLRNDSEAVIALANGRIDMVLAAKQRDLDKRGHVCYISGAVERIRHLLTEREANKLIEEGLLREDSTNISIASHLERVIEAASHLRDINLLCEWLARTDIWLHHNYRVTVPHWFKDHVQKFISNTGNYEMRLLYGDRYVITKLYDD